jgi:hypothetical protein
MFGTATAVPRCSNEYVPCMIRRHCKDAPRRLKAHIGSVQLSGGYGIKHVYIGCMCM